MTEVHEGTPVKFHLVCYVFLVLCYLKDQLEADSLQVPSDELGLTSVMDIGRSSVMYTFRILVQKLMRKHM